MLDRSFWSSQRVLLTGHTGFKGAWLSFWLERLGAHVVGLSLPPETDPNLFDLLAPFAQQKSIIGDIRDPVTVAKAVEIARPTIVIHMAAQALVRRSYREPAETFATNVMGTVNVLEALREVPELRAILVITSDKVYHNDGSGRAFVEGDMLGGSDPYSASKAAAEIAVASWAKSFFVPRRIPLATARAGNVIGGGDWSDDRLIPDLWRAALSGTPVELRYPAATRPWQHVLEPLGGYLAYIEALASEGEGVPSALNFGPAVDEVMCVSEVAALFARVAGIPEGWRKSEGSHPPESSALVLDATGAGRALGWHPKLNSIEALTWTADWYRNVREGHSAREICARQLYAYEAA
jgi:CDP-glucose 4,6-dehydratase